MKPRLTTRVLSLAPSIYEGASAAFWLFIGLGTLRVLIRLARMGADAPFGGGNIAQCSRQSAISSRRAGSSWAARRTESRSRVGRLMKGGGIRLAGNGRDAQARRNVGSLIPG